ncbi:hypothetical protein H6758_04220 [Candidatus Nomurabacteria bacterium]|nr:hypothetical protein [Candidatus Nomurabacteria bacterium]
MENFFKRFQIVIVFFIITRFFLVFFAPSHHPDTLLFYKKAQEWRTTSHSLYTDISYPYPPASIPFYIFPVLLADDYETFHQIFRIIMFVFDLLCIALIFVIATHHLKLSDFQVNLTLATYMLLSLILGLVYLERIDVVIASILLGMYLCTLCTSARWNFLGYFLGLIGILIKFFPGFLLPVMWLYHAYKQGWKWAMLYSVMTLSTLLVLIGSDMFFSTNILSSTREHLSRGIQIESTWGNLVMLKHTILGLYTPAKTTFGAQHIYGPYVSPVFVQATKILPMAILLIVYGAVWKLLKTKQEHTKTLLLSFLFTIVVFLTFQRVLSVQFFVWALPFMSLLIHEKTLSKSLLALMGACVLSLFAFFGYMQYIYIDTSAVILYSLRNLFLISGCILLFSAVYKDIFQETRAN